MKNLGGGGDNIGKGASGTIQWGEKGGLPNYRETLSVILRCVWNGSSIVEGRVSKQ